AVAPCLLNDRFQQDRTFAQTAAKGRFRPQADIASESIQDTETRCLRGFDPIMLPGNGRKRRTQREVLDAFQNRVEILGWGRGLMRPCRLWHRNLLARRCRW